MSSFVLLTYRAIVSSGLQALTIDVYLQADLLLQQVVEYLPQHGDVTGAVTLSNPEMPRRLDPLHAVGNNLVGTQQCRFLDTVSANLFSRRIQELSGYNFCWDLDFPVSS